MTLTATEEEIVAAVRSLAGRGMYVEPTSATAAERRRRSFVAAGVVEAAPT